MPGRKPKPARNVLGQALQAMRREAGLSRAALFLPASVERSTKRPEWVLGPSGERLCLLLGTKPGELCSLVLGSARFHDVIETARRRRIGAATNVKEQPCNDSTLRQLSKHYAELEKENQELKHRLWVQETDRERAVEEAQLMARLQEQAQNRATMRFATIQEQEAQIVNLKARVQQLEARLAPRAPNRQAPAQQAGASGNAQEERPGFLRRKLKKK